MPNEETNWIVECGASLPNGSFTRNHLMPINNITNFRFKYNNIGIFTTAYYYDKEDQADANLIGDFYLDLDYDLSGDDQEKAFEVIRKDITSIVRYLKILLKLDPETDLYFFFSGSKGIHITIPHEIIGVKPDKNLNRYYKMLAEDISKYTSGETVDLRIYDNRRLFRLPNSRHQKTELYKVYLSYKEIQTLSLSDIKSIAKNPRIIPKKEKKLSLKASMEMRNYTNKFNMSIAKKSSGRTSNLKLEYMPPCVEYLLAHPVKKGQRNNTIAFLTSFFKQTGITESQTIERLSIWSEEYCEPRLSEREIEATVNSIYNGSSNKMGCSTAKDISECNKEACKLNKKK